MIDPSKIVPEWDFVLIRMGEEMETPGGLVLPSAAQDLIGTVLAVGPGLIHWQDSDPDPDVKDGGYVPVGYHAPVPFDPGDRVLVQAPTDGKGNYLDPDAIDLGSGVLLLRSTALVARIEP